MIFDTLDNAARYALPGSPLSAAFEFLRSHDLNALPVGRMEIDGDRLYALVQEYLSKPVEQGKWEAHRNYIDVQYIVRGEERMGFANLASLHIGEYVAEKDFLPLSGKPNFVDLSAGSFTVFFPEDGHMPGLYLDKPEPVRKVVLKIKLPQK